MKTMNEGQWRQTIVRGRRLFNGYEAQRRKTIMTNDQNDKQQARQVKRPTNELDN